MDSSQSTMVVPDDSGKAAPFSVQLLPDELCDREHDFARTLPAIVQTANDDIVPPSLTDIAWLREELGVTRLDEFGRWLWIAGRPVPPRALHHQHLLGRKLVITEQMDLHLIWTNRSIFLKPVPYFLLTPSFWIDHLRCQRDSATGYGAGECGPSCTAQRAGPGGTTECFREQMRKSALGFLFSYVGLIRHPSDLLLAQEARLLPDVITWASWRAFVKDLDTEHIYPHIHQRFHYGELRLSRLNKMYRLMGASPLKGYLSKWNRYGSFTNDYFAWLASSILFIGLILAALQVGLETTALKASDAFQSVSAGFTVFAMVLCLMVALLWVATIAGLFLLNWSRTNQYRRWRAKHMGADRKVHDA